MTADKVSPSQPLTTAAASAETNHAQTVRYVLSGSNNHGSFRQYLDESKKNQQTETKKTQADDPCKQVRRNLPTGDLVSLKPSALLSQYPNQTDSLNLMPMFFHAGIINAGLGNNQVKLFKNLVAAKKFQKHFENLVEHARLNLDLSKIKECSTILFKSGDCATDKYRISFDKTGYTLSVETKTEQFANELSSLADVFEGYFFKKTACNLKIKIAITEELKPT